MKERSKFWLVTLAALLGAGLTASLGLWQMSRAAQKLTMQSLIEARAALPELDSKALVRTMQGEDIVQRRVRLQGRWQAQWTVFLENRQMNGRPGFYVLTPLQLADAGPVVLVQRGWAPRDFRERERLPALETPAGQVEVQGQIIPPPSKLYEFASSETGPIRQNLDLAQFAAQTGLPLLPVTVQQQGAPSEGLLREWPLIGSGVDKHYGYAFQWFGLSALIAILYVWFQFLRRPGGRTES